MAVGTGQISMEEIYLEVYGTAPTGQFSLDQLVQDAFNFQDKTPPHAMNDFLGYEEIARPAAPSNVSISQSTTTSDITVTWTDNSNDEDGFRIEKSVNSGAWSFVANTGVNATSYTDTSVKIKGNTYKYRVSAYNSQYDSSFVESNIIILQGLPSQPTSATASVIVDDVTVTWVDNSTDEDRFRVYRSASGGTFILIGSFGVNATSFLDSNLSNGSYQYRVTAVNSYGESQFSETSVVQVGSS